MTILRHSLSRDEIRHHSPLVSEEKKEDAGWAPGNHRVKSRYDVSALPTPVDDGGPPHPFRRGGPRVPSRRDSFHRGVH
jgi:hypothetical protein